jgi:hypothetical protein
VVLEGIKRDMIFRAGPFVCCFYWVSRYVEPEPELILVFLDVITSRGVMSSVSLILAFGSGFGVLKLYFEL